MEFPDKPEEKPTAIPRRKVKNPAEKNPTPGNSLDTSNLDTSNLDITNLPAERLPNIRPARFRDDPLSDKNGPGNGIQNGSNLGNTIFAPDDLDPTLSTEKISVQKFPLKDPPINPADLPFDQSVEALAKLENGSAALGQLGTLGDSPTRVAPFPLYQEKSKAGLKRGALAFIGFAAVVALISALFVIFLKAEPKNKTTQATTAIESVSTTSSEETLPNSTTPPSPAQSLPTLAATSSPRPPAPNTTTSETTRPDTPEGRVEKTIRDYMTSLSNSDWDQARALTCSSELKTVNTAAANGTQISELAVTTVDNITIANSNATVEATISSKSRSTKAIEKLKYRYLLQRNNKNIWQICSTINIS